MTSAFPHSFPLLQDHSIRGCDGDEGPFPPPLSPSARNPKHMPNPGTSSFPFFSGSVRSRRRCRDHPFSLFSLRIDDQQISRSTLSFSFPDDGPFLGDSGARGMFFLFPLFSPFLQSRDKEACPSIHLPRILSFNIISWGCEIL